MIQDICLWVVGGFNPQPQKKNWVVRIVIGLIVVWLLSAIIAGIVEPKVTAQNGYYRVNNTLYCKNGNYWFRYDAGDVYWYEESYKNKNLPDALIDNYKDYYLEGYVPLKDGIQNFEDSTTYFRYKEDPTLYININ